MLEPRLDENLNKHDKVYHQHTYDMLMSPKLNFREADRAVIHTIGGFGTRAVYDLSDGTIPLSQTKPIGYKSQLLPEIVGFIRNETNLKWYKEQGMNIWDANAFNFYRRKLDDSHPWKNLEKDTPEFETALEEYSELVLSGDNPEAGDLGRFYPEQWRNFAGITEEGVVYVDQLQDLVTRLQENPTSRYQVVTAWNPIDVKLKRAALAPCHNMFQAYRYLDREGVDRLDIQMYQRSADHFLGLGFNPPQYAALTMKIAAEIGAQPGEFLHIIGDDHIYVGGDKRAAFYMDRENIFWLQDMLKEEHPHTVREELMKRVPEEEGTPGYDHVPFMLEQLGRKSHAESPKATVKATGLNNATVQDFTVKNYSLEERADKIRINGYRQRMAS